MDVVISSSTGRSGSTLVQRIFNTREKTLIWGEHGGAVLQAYAWLYKDTLNHTNKFKEEHDRFFQSNKDPNQWTACLSPYPEYLEKAVIHSIQTFFSTFYSQYRDRHDLIGFKEIKYGERELSLLKKCYPQIKLLLLIRNPVKVWESHAIGFRGMYDHSVVNFTKRWNERVSFYMRLAKEDPNCVAVQYEKLIDQDPETMEHISEMAKVTMRQIKQVLNHKVGSVQDLKGRKPLTEEEKEIIQFECRDLMNKLGY